ncbi:hypothetical protein OIU76_022579 [Salix suchowensis]|uniref:S-protein homolog n=1 Tax=Salix suchowensis TaxID=1278906 RepID=A0ABQ9AGW4_9ROSI|nr:hypothetical protein OIU76_022579 [Salix suchowensis]KAJ6339300.1 hypothetical protein OIU77_007294 [Salix suchowensis]KAJ6374775.1 hypothetical protein OIU78_030290 [Salix suchowensis]
MRNLILPVLEFVSLAGLGVHVMVQEASRAKCDSDQRDREQSNHAYWCKFTWNETMSKQEVSAVLLVFDAVKEDEKHCAPGCQWRISSTGYRFWDGFLGWGSFSVRRLK